MSQFDQRACWIGGLLTWLLISCLISSQMVHAQGNGSRPTREHSDWSEDGLRGQT
jgi:hypothetical protein